MDLSLQLHSFSFWTTGVNRFRRALLYLFSLLLSVATAASAYSGTVNCRNSASDVSMIQSALNSGGAVTINGACAVGSSTINANNAATITGSATLNGRGGTVQINTDNVSISGLTFVSTSIYIPGPNNAIRALINITNNAFRDFTFLNEGSGIGSDMILEQSLISGNTFTNFWVGGYSNTTSNPHGLQQAAPGIQIFGGLDNTSIINNTFDEMEDDGLHVFWQGMIGNAGGFTGTNVSISYNTFTRVSRIAIELQGTGNWPGGCPGGCTGRAPVNGLAVKGNYVHLPAWPWWNTYAYSLVEGSSGSNDLFINNTGIAEPGAGTLAGGLGYGMETPCCGTGQLIQGNVLAASLPNNQGWNGHIQNYSPGSATNRNVNNLLCGNPFGSGKIANNGANTLIANIASDTCPAGVTAAISSIVSSFTSSNNQSFPSGGSATWSVAVVSNLSVKWVQFFIDNSNTPVSTQELQDVNANFANDRRWLYHLTIDTSSLPAGAHTITAKATDVAGVSQSISQTFFAG